MLTNNDLKIVKGFQMMQYFQTPVACYVLALHPTYAYPLKTRYNDFAMMMESQINKNKNNSL